jgi:H+/Cl- antiporter ClcA
MINKRFFISCVASSLAMFLLSYVWHGLILTDFSRLSYSRHLFLFFAALVYIMIGFVVTKAIDIKILEKNFKRKPIVRGLISGAMCGVAFFLVATVVGVSFSTGSKLENMLLDVTWQTIEQSLGGVVVGLVHIFVYDPSAHLEEE